MRVTHAPPTRAEMWAACLRAWPDFRIEREVHPEHGNIVVARATCPDGTRLEHAEALDLNRTWDEAEAAALRCSFESTLPRIRK